MLSSPPTSRARRSLGLATCVIVLAVIAPLGCSALIGLDGYKDYCPPEGVGKPGDCVPFGGGGGSSSSVGPACHSAQDCPPSTTCATATCEQGHCGTNDANRGTKCSDQGGNLCDGQGKCVECVSSTDCSSDTLCVKATCNAEGACATTNANPGATCSDHNGNICDGMGHCLGCNHVADCADTGTTCATVVSCDAHMCTTMNAAAGTACTDHGGNMCDDAGHCFGAKQVTVGEFHACALTTLGGVKCWGRNNAGQLGDGTKNDHPTPTDVPGLSDIKAIFAGDQYECAITSSNGLKCWGDNPDGQLGTGDENQQLSPVDVSGLSSGVGSVGVYSYGQDTCAVMSDGSVKCWGFNFYGEFGNGSSEYELTPTDLPLFSSLTQLAVGGGHLCGLGTNNVLQCMGNNGSGQLGDGTTTPRSMPVRAGDGGSFFASVVAGDAHTCGIDVSMDVFCWGSNGNGQLGIGGAGGGTAKTPQLVSGILAKSLAAGVSHTCAVTLAGGVLCWGANASGQLGDGTINQRTAPVQASGLTSGVASISAGLNTTCAVLTNGGVKCWGDGPVGDGSGTEQNSPVDVFGL